VTSEDIPPWLDASKRFFEDLDRAAESFLTLVGAENRTAFAYGVTQLLAVLLRGEELPPVPDADAQRHFAAGLARYKVAAETLARTDDQVEVNHAIRAIHASNADFARMYEALERRVQED
jgi:hypothetical protein